MRRPDKSLEEPMVKARTCSHCGSQNLQDGRMWVQAELRFRPEGMKFLTLSSGAHTTASACLNCGAVGFWTDPEEIRGLMKDTFDPGAINPNWGSPE
jgi:hypothetical protein